MVEMTPADLLMWPKATVRGWFTLLAAAFAAAMILDPRWEYAFAVAVALLYATWSWRNVAMLDGSKLYYRNIWRWRCVDLSRLRSIKTHRGRHGELTIWIRDSNGNAFGFERWFWDTRSWPLVLRRVVGEATRSLEPIEINARTKNRLARILRLDPAIFEQSTANHD